MKPQQKLNKKNISNHNLRQKLGEKKDEVLQISQDDLVDFNSHDQFKKKNSKPQHQVLQFMKNTHYLYRNVPIYRIQSKYDSIIAGFDQFNTSQYFAHGHLFGKFYQSSQLFYLQNISFVGNFKGMFDWQQKSQKYNPVYFQGKINKIQFLTVKDQIFQNKSLNQISFYKSSFHGYFKGYFYPWSVVGGIQNIYSDSLSFKDKSFIPLSFDYLKEANYNEKSKINLVSINRIVQYNLPTLVCFQIMNIGNINLEKSSAVVNGNLKIQIKYNTFIDQILTFHKKNNKKLSIAINFNRDITLFLPLQEEQDEQCESDNESQWSLQQKVWDIELTKDKENRILHYRIIKKLKAEIDNSYGGFFAPFNLNQLRIVIHFTSITLNYKSQKIKINFTCVDTFDYGEANTYDPFLHFNSLSKKGVSLSQVNRYYKINRHLCHDNGEYIIADNRLALYPHYKNILKNKSLTNNDTLWTFGLRNYLPFLQPNLANKIPTTFQQLTKIYEQNEQRLINEKFQTFSFLNWQNVIIQIPIYKYIVIDMLKIFVPLTIVAILSLFIFNQQNGVGHDSQFTTLAYRLANVAAIAITFSNLIPITLKSLPPMPGITLIQIIIYLQAIPSFLAIINSMVYYRVSIQQWRRDYKAFNDGLFILSFILSVINFIIIICIFWIYMFIDYTIKWDIASCQKELIQWKSPQYLKFIQSVQAHKSQYYNIIQQNV